MKLKQHRLSNGAMVYTQYQLLERSCRADEFAERIRSPRPEFVPSWAPFGEFGLDGQQLCDRFEEIAHTPESSLRLLDDWDANLIRRAQRQLQCLGRHAE